MTKVEIDDLFERGLLDQEAHDRLCAIENKSVFSLYYELRTLLYLGVLLLSTGIGILIYNNIGQIGHFLSLTVLLAGTVAAWYYVGLKHLPYSNERVEEPNPYTDYVLLLGCLLFLSLLGYLQFLFGVFDDYLGFMSLITAGVFFFLAYRFDHLGVLSMGIVAFASFWGITVSPMQGYMYDFFGQLQLQLTGVFVGVGLFAAGLMLKRLGIKKHFTKTYLNFGIVIGFVGSTSLLFQDDDNQLIALVQLLAAVALGIYSIKRRTMLYMIYAFVFGFIGLSYALLASIDFEIGFILFYIFISCAAFIVFVIYLKAMKDR